MFTSVQEHSLLTMLIYIYRLVWTWYQKGVYEKVSWIRTHGPGNKEFANDSHVCSVQHSYSFGVAYYTSKCIYQICCIRWWSCAFICDLFVGIYLFTWLCTDNVFCDAIGHGYFNEWNRDLTNYLWFWRVCTTIAVRRKALNNRLWRHR